MATFLGSLYSIVSTPYPITRGLKGIKDSTKEIEDLRVSTPYPITRGLKVKGNYTGLMAVFCFNALPDNKGTESIAVVFGLDLFTLFQRLTR